MENVPSTPITRRLIVVASKAFRWYYFHMIHVMLSWEMRFRDRRLILVLALRGIFWRAWGGSIHPACHRTAVWIRIWATTAADKTQDEKLADLSTSDRATTELARPDMLMATHSFSSGGLGHTSRDLLYFQQYNTSRRSSRSGTNAYLGQVRGQRDLLALIPRLRNTGPPYPSFYLAEHENLEEWLRFR